MADPFVLVPVADPMVGMAIGSFVIIQVLGRGGMGAVYLAQHKAAAHIRCVFKTILAHLSNHPLMISRFNTEIEAVGRLKHENIVELKDFGVLPHGQMYMQFEFIEGTPLDRFVAQWGGRLSLHRAVYLAFQVCDALDHAHASGVVHRDLKPENLMVVVQDKKRVPRLVKLVDFGVSKVARAGETQTMSGVKMGTPYFMSVEQYANAAEATGKSDVYSLAIVIWWMITGELPWGRPDPNVLYHVQQTVIPAPPPESVMPAAVARLLLRCLSVDPDDRPTAQELGVELAAVIPATDDAPGGGAILLHIAPHFLASSPDHARTMPRSALANPDLVAAQLWPPVSVARALAVQPDPAPRGAAGSGPVVALQPGVAPGGLPSLASSRSASEPDAADAVPAAPRMSASMAPASPSSSGATAAPPRAESEPAVRSLPTSDPDVEAPGAPSRPGAPVIAALPTGLISQKHVAQDPPVELLSAAPRVRSIVAAAEIDLAAGTPGPEPYAHSELPAVLVSKTQLTGPGAPPRNAAVMSAAGHEPAPFIVLPADAVPRARLARSKLVLLGLTASVLAGIMVLAVTRLHSHMTVAVTSEESGNQAVSRSGADAAIDARATALASAEPTAPAADRAGSAIPSKPSPPQPVNNSTNEGQESTGQAATPNAGTSSPPTPSSPSVPRQPESVTRAARAASSETAAVEGTSTAHGGAAASRPSRNTSAKSPEQGSLPARVPTPVPQSDSPSEVTLVIRVRGFANVSIDGDEPSASPRRKRVKVGVHHVVMSGYPDGSEEKQTTEFDVNVPAGRPEIVVHKTW